MHSYKRKIAFIIPSLRPGGAERMLLTVANDLATDHEVHIIFLKETGDFLQQLSPSVKRWDINNGSIYFSFFAVRKILKKIGPDIFFPWMGYLNAYLVFFKPFLNKKMRWVCRESSIPSLMNAHYKFSFLYTFFYRFYNRYDAIVCQSNYMAEDLVHNFGVKKEKIEVINNPVDDRPLDRLVNEPLPPGTFSEKGYRLLYVGGLHEWKRVHLLVQATAELPEEYSLIIVGDGTERPSIEKAIEANDLQKRVKIIPGITNPFPYYSAADCLILCSKFEGFPNVVTEAMLAGCPVIGFDIKGGANEILANYGGFIAEGTEPGSWAQVITEVCEKKVLDKERISAESRQNYNIEKIMAQYRSLLSKLEICAG